MTKFKLKKAVTIKGFYIIYDYLTSLEESDLINKLNNQKWIVDYQRQLQYYNYRNELIKPYDLVPIPEKIPRQG